MEEMLEKMSLTTSSGKALLRPASFSSSWKNTCKRGPAPGHTLNHPPVPKAQGDSTAPAELGLHPCHAPGRDGQGRMDSSYFTEGTTSQEVPRTWSREQGKQLHLCHWRPWASLG